MFRKLGLFVLTSSLLAVCQTPVGVVINSGTATSGVSGPRLLGTPNVSLPGSGPATGLPPAVGVNDPRYGGSGSVFQPGGIVTGTAPVVSIGSLPTSTSNANGSDAENSTNAAAANTPGAFKAGMGAFAEYPSNQPETSLGDIARQYKSQRASMHPREFDNNNIRHGSYGTSDANSAALPQSDQPIATYGSSGDAPHAEGALNQRDYAAVQAALARTQAATNTSRSDNAMASSLPDPNRSLTPYEASGTTPDRQSSDIQAGAANANTAEPQGNNAAQSASQATTPQVDDQASSTNKRPTNARPKKQLPASASSLPLIAVLGLIALAIGGIFTYRLRPSEVRG